MSNTRNTSESQDSHKPQKTQESRTENDNSATDGNATDGGTDRDRAAERRMSPVEVLREARAQLAELTGMTVESVTSFERTEDGWSLEVEVLELTRVPDTMSLMASYLVELDHEGLLTGYRRLGRYERGRADAHRGR
ncbi:gas vesicle protein [Streptomyces sp. NPDC015220]|uniref:gas vesicle protein GvpO n=1 Tax=Streptomyces sp. NPDC015220 TaxID=3364947 RepID=UPI0036FCA586